MSEMPAIAAILGAPGEDFSVAPITIGALREGEIAVRIIATGICHTDLLVQEGRMPFPMPGILGHEGAGVVIAIGDSVTTVVPGDHVVLSFVACGDCAPCRADHPASCAAFGSLNFAGARIDGSHAVTLADGGAVGDRFFGQSSLATIAVALERNAVRVRKDAPLHLLGPLGCGVQTGAGAVLNSFALPKGASIAVFGSGAVGLSAILAAVVAEAGTIIAIDRVEERLQLAMELGATHALPASDSIGDMIREIVPGGLDFALDTTGAVAVIDQAIAALGARGTCGLVGAAPRGAHLSIDASTLMKGSQRIIGIIEGDSDPQIFIPHLIELYLDGRFPFDRLIEAFPLEQINEAIRASHDGRVVKPIILMPDAGAVDVAAPAIPASSQ